MSKIKQMAELIENLFPQKKMVVVLVEVVLLAMPICWLNW